MKDKVLILFLIVTAILFITETVYSQDVDTTVTSSYSGTITETNDSVQVTFSTKKPYNTITVYTSSGEDTLNVYIRSTDGNSWSQRVCIGLFDKVPYETIIATTTPKEYLIYEPRSRESRIYPIRVITSDVSADCSINISNKQ